MVKLVPSTWSSPATHYIFSRDDRNFVVSLKNTMYRDQSNPIQKRRKIPVVPIPNIEIDNFFGYILVGC